MKLRIGSRGSQLALWQANHVAGLLRGQGHEVEIEIVKTTGDRLQDMSFVQVGAKGMFTKEIEEALARGQVDLAVHSLKDLPTELPQGFALAATAPRADPRDALVSPNYESIAALPRGARVGTSSQRRRAELKALRPDVEAIEFRGNVDTRLRKLGDGQAEAILLAAAGLDRLGHTDWLRQRLDPGDFCPAAGQGCLAIETREGDAATQDAVGFLDDADTRYAVTAERAALAALGGGCQVPIGVYCRPLAEMVAGGEESDEIFAVVADPQTGAMVRAHHSAARVEGGATMLGQRVAQLLMEKGAGPLLKIAAGG